MNMQRLSPFHANAYTFLQTKNQGVFVKHYAPGDTKVQKAIF